MKRARIYVAGPDVFKPDAPEIYERYVKMCRTRGADCLFPSDDIVEKADTKTKFAANIYQANIKMLNQANVVIANVEPFQGPNADAGTAFEMGYATARGIPVVAFCSRPMKPYFERQMEFYGHANRDENGLHTTDEGILLEDFGLSDNLMLAMASNAVVHSSFEEALEEGLRLWKPPIAHEFPEKNFPIWLDTFDNSNDQHDITLERMKSFLGVLKERVPESWKRKGSMNVLDLACGDGRFSRRLIDLIKSKLGLAINYMAVDLNEDFVSQAQAEIPGGIIKQGNIFDEATNWIPADYRPDLIIMSHSIYFAKDKHACVRRLSRMGTPDTMTLYILNNPIYREIEKDIDQLTGALVSQAIPHSTSFAFNSYVYMPQKAIQHIGMLSMNPDYQSSDIELEKTRNLLSFFQQTPLSQFDAANRLEYLEKVRNDLCAYRGKIPVQNHLVVSLRPDSPHSLHKAVEWAVKATDDLGFHQTRTVASYA